MARRPISGVVRDGSGNIVASVSVALTVYATSLPATCYAAESGGSALASGTTTAGTDGAYELWVDDEDHAVLTIFTVTSTKAGYITKSRSFAA